MNRANDIIIIIYFNSLSSFLIFFNFCDQEDFASSKNIWGVLGNNHFILLFLLKLFKSLQYSNDVIMRIIDFETFIRLKFIYSKCSLLKHRILLKINYIT
jgi:hypothetical protein